MIRQGSGEGNPSLNSKSRGKDNAIAITIITITEMTTKMSGNMEKTASPLLMCLLTLRKRAPDTSMAKPAKKNDTRLK
jgi:hypothetical protein